MSTLPHAAIGRDSSDAWEQGNILSGSHSIRGLYTYTIVAKVAYIIRSLGKCQYALFISDNSKSRIDVVDGPLVA